MLLHLLLELLLLLLVFLLQLLRLLLVPLLHLLSGSVIGVSFRQLLMFLILLLLQFVALLLLLGQHLVLLLLVLVVLLLIARTRQRRMFHGGQIMRMHGRTGSSIRTRSVRPSRCFRRRHAVSAEFPRLLGRGDRRSSHVRRSAQLRIASRLLTVLGGICRSCSAAISCGRGRASIPPLPPLKLTWLTFS